MSINIAYYEESQSHTEIFGFILYIIKDKNYNMTLFNDKDMSDYANYFKKFYNYDTKKTDELISLHEKYDKIIIGSSCDMNKIKNNTSLFENIKNKIIYIVHIKEHLLEINDNSNIIVLTPINVISKNTLYFLPIHGFYDNTIYKKKNILSIIGQCHRNYKRNIQSVITFITKYPNEDYTFHFYSRSKSLVSPKLIEMENQYPDRIKIFIGLNGNSLEHHITNSKFILPLVPKDSIYHKDRITGSIPLAYNYNVPLVIDTQLKEIYQIKSCIEYKNDISEVIDVILNLSDGDYTNMVNNFIIEKNIILKQNINKLLF